jgi:hypothetical protein
MTRKWKWLLAALLVVLLLAGGWRAVAGRSAQQAAEA